jgi:hypothetical protein
MRVHIGAVDATDFWNFSFGESCTLGRALTVPWVLRRVECGYRKRARTVAMSDEERPGRSRRGSGKADRGSGADRAARPAIAQDVVQRFADAYWHYVGSLQQLTIDDDLHQRIASAYVQYTTAAQGTQAISAEARDRVMRSYWSAREAAPTSAGDAYRDMMNALSDAAGENTERVAAAQRELALASQEAPSALEQRADEAFAEYVEEVKAAWSAADAGGLAPDVLLAIAQSLAAAAAARAMSTQALEQARRAASAVAPAEA